MKRVTLRIFLIFFSSGFSFTDTDDSQDSRVRDGTMFYSSLPPLATHEYSDTYLQHWMWDDYHIVLIASPVTNKLLLDEIYHLIQLPFDWLVMQCLFLFVYLMKQVKFNQEDFVVTDASCKSMEIIPETVVLSGPSQFLIIFANSFITDVDSILNTTPSKKLVIKCCHQSVQKIYQ